MTLLQGSIPALITPMTSTREIDIEGFKKFVEFQIANGSHALVPMGTTGESPTLTHEEHKQIIDTCIAVSNKRVPVIAGTGSNSTREAVALTQYAKDAGADAALIVVPYYNKPTQEGMYQHYLKIATSVDIPIIIYNIPGRSVVRMEPETFKRLYDAMPKSFVGMKDATGQPDFTKKVLKALNGDFVSLCGDDGLYQDFVENGATGCISVTANIAPKMCSDLNNAMLKGDMETFTRIQAKLLDLHNSLFVESNPAPVKYAAMKLGIIKSDEVRLPMVTVSDETKNIVDAALKKAGLLD